MILETEQLRLTGIPAGLVAPYVPLDDVFIPIEFFPKRLPSDYPLTKEEFAYYHDHLQRGLMSEEMERAFAGTEKTWLDILKEGDKVSIPDLWRQLTKDHPTVVIQGYPGMGKSTLMARLTLHLARCGLNQPDPSMGTRLAPARSTPIPILLQLKDYAVELEKALANSHTLSLMEYLKIAIDRLHLVDLFPYLQECLGNGRCLVMLDGLDEVSDLNTRKQVKQAIETFILDHRYAKKDFNRFLITSRVAGYDVIAFSEYLHFTIAELTPEQIDGFLPRWCRANVRREFLSVAGEQEERIVREAEQMAGNLSKAVHTNQAVRKLAENPLLLTLLAVMQQNSTNLPERRVELYDVVTRTLLENRNIAKDLKPIPEIQAIQRLGPIAFQMQETGNSFARQRNVKEALREIIKSEGGTPEDIAQEVENFLARIRERGGLFVIRTGDYFGFFHRTFQEYFAARDILNRIKVVPTTWIAELVKRVRRADDLWRETFLLAVAYQSGEDEIVARKIIQALLDVTQSASFAHQAHDLLLAAECLIEAKPATIGSALEKHIAQQLLQTYEHAQRIREFKICERIENIMRRWLINLPEEAYRPAPLLILNETVSNIQDAALQHATLTLLAMIAQQLINSPPIVFDMLVPTLLALAGLPPVGKFYPAKNLTVSSNFDVIDLAIAALLFMGKRGPAGAFLVYVRQHFEDHPEHLRQLAHNSLECGILITPVMVPLSKENYRNYETAIGQWIVLRDYYQKEHITKQDIDTCLGIHKKLLSCAEEVSYLTAMHFLKMLQETADNPAKSWQQSWKDYLLRQMAPGSYISYQEAALLWAMLFPEGQELMFLVQCILKHYNGHDASLQCFAQRFMASISNSLRDLRNMRDKRSKEKYMKSRDMTELVNMRDLNNVTKLVYMRYPIYIMELSYIENVEKLGYIQELRNPRDVRNSMKPENLSCIDYPSDTTNLLLTEEVAEKAKEILSSVNSIQNGTMLRILLGRVLHIEEIDEMGDAVEDEVQKIANIAVNSYSLTGTDEAREASLDILRYLPARSENEISFVLQLAEEASDEQIQRACAESLEYAESKTADAWAALEKGKQSKVKVAREAVEEALERKNRWQAR